MGIFDGALAYLFGNGDTSQETKPAPTQNLAGVGQPVSSLYGNISYPDFQKYVSDQQGARGVISTMLARGIGPGLGQAIAPESSFMPNYIAGLEGAQKAYATGLGFPKMELISDFYAHPEKYTGQGGMPAPQGGAPQQHPPPSDGQSWGGAASQPNGIFSQPQQQPGLLGGAPAQTPMSQNPAFRASPDVLMGQGAPAPAGNNFMGIPLPPNLSPMGAAVASAVQPELYKAYVNGLYADHRSGSYGMDPRTGQPGFFAPSIAGVSTASGMPGSPGYEQRALQFQRQEQQNIAGAQLGKDEAIRGLDYYLRTGQKPPGGWIPGSGGGGGGNPPPAPAPRGAPAAAPQGGMPAAAAPQQKPDGSIQTERGTVIPSPQNQRLPQGEEPLKIAATNSGKTEENWNSVRQVIDQNRVRLGALSQVFSTLDTKGLTVGKAEGSNILRGLGMNWLADQVMSAKDTASVQQALWLGMQDVLAQLKTINTGTGGRILNSEFNAFLEHAFSPNMLGPALHSAITQQLGQVYQVQNMIDDFQGEGRKAGWTDANQFQSHYLRANPLEGFTKYAEQTVPEFGKKGAQRVEMNLPQPGSKLTPGTGMVNGRTYKWVD